MSSYRVYCGLADFYVLVEASSKEEAIEIGKREFVKLFQECDTYWARASIQPDEVLRG